MRCRKARNLLELAADEPAVARRNQSLLSHLQECPACRAYRQRLQALGEATRASAEALSEYTPSSQFQEGLHCALQAESQKRSHTPAERLSQAISITTRLPALARALNAAAALAAAIWFALTLLSAPQPRPAECHFGHIASLSVKRFSDGRIVAALTDRDAPSRACLRQEYGP